MPDSALKYELADFPAVAQVWASTERKIGDTYFQSESWQQVWAAFGGQYGFTPKVLSVKDGIETVLISSMVFSEIRTLFLFRQRAVFLNGSGQTEYDVICSENCQPLIAATDRQGVLSEFLNYLFSHTGVSHLFIRAVPSDSADDIARASARHGLQVHEEKRIPHHLIDLAKLRDHKLTHLQAVSHRARSTIKKSIESYKKKFGNLHIQYASSADEAKRWLNNLITLNKARLEDKNVSSSFSYPFLEEFHMALIDLAFPKNEIFSAKINAGEQVMGYVYGFLYKEVVSIYQTGFNFSLDSKSSPGLVSHHLLADRALQQGLRAYDFLAGDYQYKRSLSNQHQELVWLRISKPGLILSLESGLRKLKNKFSR